MIIIHYCVDYRKDFKYVDDIEELNITFRQQDTTLIDFLLLHKKQRINIYIEDEEYFIEKDCIKIFDAIAEKYPEINFFLKLRDCHDSNVKYIVEIIKNNKIKHKFYFTSFTRDWDSLFGIIEMRPSDVYIVEELGFEIEAASKILHSAGVNVRVFANVAQSSWYSTPALKKFFIRPEDVYIYEPCVDAIEFFGYENSINTIYKIYAIDKKWSGKLNELILSFNDNEIDSRFILPQFAVRRLNCGKRCLKGKPCNICNAIENLATVLESENLMIKNFKND